MRGGVATLSLLVVAACAGIPSSGPVTRVEDDTGLGESTVRYSPTGPADGASPEQVVRGYLDAMLAFPTSVRTVASFLTRDAARSWDPSAGVTVYSSTEVSGRVPSTTGLDEPGNASRGAVDVRVGFREDARLDPQGHYTRRDRAGATTFTLEQVEGEWRISNPDDGLMVSRKFYGDYFRDFDLFFFDRPGRRLVPDPVHLLVGDQLATTLMTSLARGPSPALADAARTYVPPLDRLRPSVPVSSQGVADVEFTDDLGATPDAAQDRLSAQVVWTLRQVPGLEAAQVVGGSTPLTANEREVQPISSWGGFGPSLARGHAYAIADDRVVQLDDTSVQRLSGAWGKDARGAVLVAVSEAGVAGVLAGRDRVRVTDRDGGDALTLRGRELVAPRWDDDGTLWLVDRPRSTTRVRVVEGRRPRTLEVRRLAGTDVDTFALSPDGTRYAVSSSAGGGVLRVGAVLRDAKDRVTGLGTPRRVPTDARRPRSATWSSSTGLGFLAEDATGVQAYEVAIDGSATSDDLSGGAVLPDVGATTLAIGPGDPPELYATDARDRLWVRVSEGTWRLVKAAEVTGLTFGR